MDSEIEILMVEIVRHGEANGLPPIFQVTLAYSDHSSSWEAYAQVRCGDSYTATGTSPEAALRNLIAVLTALLCPHCGQRMPKEK